MEPHSFIGSACCWPAVCSGSSRPTRMKRCKESFKTDGIRGFPGGPVAKTLHSQCRGPRFNPSSKLDPTCHNEDGRSRMLQLRPGMAKQINNCLKRVKIKKEKTQELWNERLVFERSCSDLLKTSKECWSTVHNTPKLTSRLPTAGTPALPLHRLQPASHVALHRVKPCCARV